MNENNLNRGELISLPIKNGYPKSKEENGISKSNWTWLATHDEWAKAGQVEMNNQAACL